MSEVDEYCDCGNRIGELNRCNHCDPDTTTGSHAHGKKEGAYVVCNQCMWSGEDNELTAVLAEDCVKFCPACGADDGTLMDIDAIG